MYNNFSVYYTDQDFSTKEFVQWSSPIQSHMDHLLFCLSFVATTANGYIEKW